MALLLLVQLLLAVRCLALKETTPVAERVALHRHAEFLCVGLIMIGFGIPCSFHVFQFHDAHGHDVDHVLELLLELAALALVHQTR